MVNFLLVLSFGAVLLSGCNEGGFTSSQSSQPKISEVQEQSPPQDVVDFGSGEDPVMQSNQVVDPAPVEEIEDRYVLEQSECVWSAWIRRENTQPTVTVPPFACDQKQYMAGSRYLSYTGSADGVIKMQCCGIKEAQGDAFAKKEDQCEWQPWMTLPAQASECREGFYVSDIDYSSQQVHPRGDGRLRVRCCPGSGSKKLGQEQCSWSDWSPVAKTEAAAKDMECEQGKYVAGMDYDQNSDGRFGGSTRIKCCSP